MAGLAYSEFMSTFGIQINNKKTFYTTSPANASHKTAHNILKAPTTEGYWEGNLDGTWTPNANPTTQVTIKQRYEPVRYLGVHFTMNGDWTHQTKILETTLITCLSRIRQRNLPPEQFAYLINAIVIPKRMYPLNIISITTCDKHSTFVQKMDKLIADFTKL